MFYVSALFQIEKTTTKNPKISTFHASDLVLFLLFLVRVPEKMGQSGATHLITVVIWGKDIYNRTLLIS